MKRTDLSARARVGALAWVCRSVVEHSALNRNTWVRFPPDLLMTLIYADGFDIYKPKTITTGNIMHSLSGMGVTVEVKRLLEILKINKENHARIVKEAREGYVKEAEKILRERLNELLAKARDGKIVDLRFNLSPPQDYTEIYDSFIGMLEMHTDSEIDLDGEQYRNFVEDKWDWTEIFYASNSAYSVTAADIAYKKGF